MRAGEVVARRQAANQPRAGGERLWRQPADGRVSGAVEAVDRMLGRVKRSQQGRRIGGVRVASGQRQRLELGVTRVRLGAELRQHEQVHARIEWTAQQRG